MTGRSSLVSLLLLLSATLMLQGGGGLNDYYMGKSLSQWAENLKSPDAKVRDDAILWVGKIGRPAEKIAPHLRPLLDDVERKRRLNAAIAYWSITGDGKEALPVIQNTLNTALPGQAYDLIRVLEKINPPDEKVLAAFLLLARDPDHKYRLQEVAEKHVPASAPVYRKFFESTPVQDRAAALVLTPQKLILLNDGDLLANFIKDANAAVRGAAAAGLVILPKWRNAAIETLIALADGIGGANDDDDTVARKAVVALAGVRPTPKHAENVFLKALNHEHQTVKFSVCGPLLELHENDREAILPKLLPALEAAFQDRELRVATYMFIQRHKLNSPKLTPMFLALLRRATTQSDVAVALCGLDPNDPSVKKAIADAVFADSARKSPIFLVGNLGRHAAALEEPIKQRLTGDDKAAKAYAFRVMQSMPRQTLEGLVPTLTDYLKLDNAHAGSAVETLKYFGTSARPAMPNMLELLKRPTGETWANRILPAVQNIRPDAKSAEPAFQFLVDKLKTGGTRDERFLAIELGLLIPERRKEAAALMLPLLRDPLGAKPMLLSPEATRLVARLESDAEPLLPDLVKLMDTSTNYAAALAKAFETIGPSAKWAVPALLEQVDKTPNRQHSHTMIALCRAIAVLDPSKRGELDKKLVPVLTEELTKTRGYSRAPFIPTLNDMCKKVGVSRQYEELLVKVLRLPENPHTHSLVAEMLLKIDRAHEDEIVKTFEAVLPKVYEIDGVGPNQILAPLLTLRPEHPVAVAHIERMLTSSQPFVRRDGLKITAACGRNVPGLRPIVEDIIRYDELGNLPFAYVTMMKFDNKLHPARVDELFEMLSPLSCSGNVFAIEAMTHLGSLGRPLAPRLLALRAEPTHPLIRAFLDSTLARTEGE